MPTDPPNADALAVQVAPLVFRTDLESPGFALLEFGTGLTPAAFRGLVIRLGQALARCYRDRFGEDLHFISASRFDQQAPTRPHRDGGPDASLLLLGYEPTEVASRIYLLDCTRAAVDRGLTPAQLLDCCNPAFGGDEQLLGDYTTEVAAFRTDHYQVLVVNNSILPYAERQRGMLGVLHHAVIATPSPDRTRPIDSVLMGVAAVGLTVAQLEAFAEKASAATV
jgi:hypothetical protein